MKNRAASGAALISSNLLRRLLHWIFSEIYATKPQPWDVEVLSIRHLVFRRHGFGVGTNSIRLDIFS